jgi:hypothetical protein
MSSPRRWRGEVAPKGQEGGASQAQPGWSPKRPRGSAGGSAPGVCAPLRRDTAFSLYSSSVRIFSVSDRTQRYVTSAPSSGGTWIANDRFAWATMPTSSTVLGKVMQWTPAAGASVLRSEYFYRPTSSSDGKWIAGTLLTDQAAPRTFIAPLGTGRTFRTGLASSPGFVTTTVVWYAVEKAGASTYDYTAPSGQVHALDVVNLTDKAVTFRAGESPWSAYTGVMLCCGDWGSNQEPRRR